MAHIHKRGSSYWSPPMAISTKIFLYPPVHGPPAARDSFSRGWDLWRDSTLIFHFSKKLIASSIRALALYAPSMIRLKRNSCTKINRLRTLQRIMIRTNHVLCTKIRFSSSAWSLYKDCHPLAHLRYKYHWWELSNEILHETFHQWAIEIPKVKLLHFWIYLIKGHFLGTFDFNLW